MTAIPWQAFFDPGEIDPNTGKLLESVASNYRAVPQPVWVDDDDEDEDAAAAAEAARRQAEDEANAANWYGPDVLADLMSRPQYRGGLYEEEDIPPEYRELEDARELAKARRREAQIKANIAQYRLEHPEATTDAD